MPYSLAYNLTQCQVSVNKHSAPFSRDKSAIEKGTLCNLCKVKKLFKHQTLALTLPLLQLWNEVEGIYPTSQGSCEGKKTQCMDAMLLGLPKKKRAGKTSHIIGLVAKWLENTGDGVTRSTSFTLTPAGEAPASTRS